MISSNIRDLLPDERSEVVGGTRAVEDADPVREASLQIAVAVGQRDLEVAALSFDPVEHRTNAPGRSPGVHEQDEGAVRHQVSDRDVQLEHRLDAETARDALVDERRVQIAVADDIGAAREGRPDHVLGELGARRGKESGLGPGGHLAAVEQQLPDPLADRRPAGLPRRHDLVAVLRQIRTEELGLRRLPRAVHALERHEHVSTIRPVRAIVTGGAGFIGSHVVDALLERGDSVIVVDNFATGKRENVPTGADLAEVDIRADEMDALFDDARPDVCFHLAAQADVRVSVERPAEDASVNVLGTVRVLEAARRNGAQVVFASTGGAIYGECERPAVEGDPRLPVSPYGAAKLAGEEYLAAYNRLYGSGNVSLRFGNVYGPRQDPHGEAGVVAIFLGRIAAGTPCTIFGDGRQTRDYVYVGDVVRATLAAVGHNGVFNVGTGTETSVLELHERCRAVAGGGEDADHAAARIGELQRSSLDPSLARQELGWQPEVSLDDGLRATWESIA
jgi:UDP-glucose 4-epimerase